MAVREVYKSEKICFYSVRVKHLGEWLIYISVVSGLAVLSTGGLHKVFFYRQTFHIPLNTRVVP